MSSIFSNTSERITTIGTSVVIKNFSFDERKALVADKISTIVELTRKKNEKTGKLEIVSRREVESNTEKIRFNLIEITVEQLANVRKTNIPSFVLKEYGKYYYTKIHPNISFVATTLLGYHRCVDHQLLCARLSAAPDEKGGCAAIRDGFSCIENYPFIKVGYETFNTKTNSLVIIECSHFRVSHPKPHRSIEEIKAAKLKLATFVWPDVKSLAEVNLRKKHNREKYGNYY